MSNAAVFEVWGIDVPISLKGRLKWPDTVREMTIKHITDGAKIVYVAKETGASLHRALWSLLSKAHIRTPNRHRLNFLSSSPAKFKSAIPACLYIQGIQPIIWLRSCRQSEYLNDHSSCKFSHFPCN